jgi:CRP-like cAMP-binding protein
MRRLVAVVQVQDPLPADAEIFTAGRDAQEMYFVISGEVEIRKEKEATVLSTVGEGGFFGEIGVLFAGRRTADAVVGAGAPGRLARLSRTDLNKVANECGCRDQLYAQGQALPNVRSWFVARLPLFAHCAGEPGFLSAVAGTLQVRRACARDVMVREGEAGNEMFFLFEGNVSITKRDGRARAAIQLAAPNFFGELALLYSEPRSATVVCEDACRFYVLGSEALHEIMQQFPRVIGMVYSTAQEASNLKSHFIKKIPLFKSMLHNEEFVANMQLALESSSAAPGEHLVRQGATSDGRMYAIAHGHAEVRKVKRAGEGPQTVATLGAGAIFGEVALLLDTPRVASVVAVGHCHVYTLSRDAFETLAVVYEAWWRDLTSERGVLVKQLMETGVAIGAEATTHTHGLRIPQLAGASVSSMLSAAQAPAAPEAAASGVPEARLCLVCRAQEKNMLSVPCGHIVACAECHDILRACPLCRTPIEKGMRAYF